MKNTAKGYFLKEYGSWSVLILSYFIGVGVSRGFDWETVPVLLSLGFLINSKQAFMKWTRGADLPKSAYVFLFQVLAATIVLLAVFGNDVPRLLPLLIVPAAYLLMNRFVGEHHLLTEALGFALLSLAAPLAKFTVTGDLDLRLYAASAVYFIAGVFKVRALLRKRLSDRINTALYAISGLAAYAVLGMPVIILLPLVDNFVVAATLYRVKLKTTGWIEVAKSLAFLILMLVNYGNV